MDSRAMTTAMLPHVSKAYDIQPSEASRAGVKYEIANGDEIPNLREKLRPVVAAEGSWKGLRAQVVNVSKALLSVRSLVGAGHVMIFGDGEDGSQNCILNKITGEQTAVKDYGSNYFLGLHIAPRRDAGFARPER